VYQIITKSLKSNVLDIHLMIIVLSGRIEETHQENIKRFTHEWMSLGKRNINNFLFIYNKTEDMSEFDRLENQFEISKKFGLDQLETKEGKVVLTTGFPRFSFSEKNIRKSEEELMSIVLKERNPIKLDTSMCVIL